MKLKEHEISNIKIIKSPIILKYILYTHLWKNKLLDLIKYNKGLQNKFEIDLENYKKTSQKYLVIDELGFGKEYIINTNILIFEGEYINGKKAGKGKEYDDEGNLIFDGVYLNGKKYTGNGYDGNGNLVLNLNEGKGEEYFNNKQIKFEGEYFDGRKWSGKGYNFDGNEVFEIKNGKGKVLEYYNNGILKYEGEYFNGKRNFKGIDYDNKDYFKFEGEYLNGKHVNGNGYDCDRNLIFTLKDGFRKDYYNNGKIKFSGEHLY